MASINSENIFAVVVWYHPQEKEAEAIRLYYEDVARVVVVDNSETDNSRLLQSLGLAVYLPLFGNKGIAAALNHGCRYAQAHGAEWVLTMDQDSRWDQQSVRAYIAEANAYPEKDQVGIFSPFHDCDGTPEIHHRHGRFEPREVVMCSGNLLRLADWQAAGGFREDFFIDMVDDEMCRHLWQLGRQVIRLNNIYLTHLLGEGRKLLGLTKHPYTPHPAWRYYYIGRNMRRMMQLYPAHARYYRKWFKKELKRLCLYDWDDKMTKLKNYLRGWREGKSYDTGSNNTQSVMAMSKGIK